MILATGKQYGGKRKGQKTDPYSWSSKLVKAAETSQYITYNLCRCLDKQVRGFNQCFVAEIEQPDIMALVTSVKYDFCLCKYVISWDGFGRNQCIIQVRW